MADAVTMIPFANRRYHDHLEETARLRDRLAEAISDLEDVRARLAEMIERNGELMLALAHHNVTVAERREDLRLGRRVT